MVAGVKRYKFQALVMLNGKEPDARPGPDPRRMVLRGRNDESRRSKLFSALISCDDDGPFRPGGGSSWSRCGWRATTLPTTSVSAAISTCGWGTTFGQGVVTRRLFV